MQLKSKLKEIDAHEVFWLYNRAPKYKVRKQGRFRIEKEVVPANRSIHVVTKRQMLYGGMRPLIVQIAEPVTFHRLWSESDGCWMSTHFQEIAGLIEPIQKAHGNVLIGGLGMGLAAHLMAEQSAVSNVTVVEIDPDLIKLIRPMISKEIEIVQDDLFRYLQHTQRQYHYGYYDIWQRCGEWTWQTMIVKLRRLSREKVKKVDCWEEQQIKDQVLDGIHRAVDIPEDYLHGRFSFNHKWVFRMACRDIRPKARADMKDKDLPFTLMQYGVENAKDPIIRKRARIFVNNVGTPLWEKMFGAYWDESESWAESDDVPWVHPQMTKG